jgi:hypothetical protein
MLYEMLISAQNIIYGKVVDEPTLALFDKEELWR